MSKISDDGISLCRWLTSRVLIAPLRHRYPCPQLPPCTSDTQSTQGDTCGLRPPVTTNKPANLHSAKRRMLPVRLLSCCAVLCCAERCFFALLPMRAVTQSKHLLRSQPVWNLLWYHLALQVWATRLTDVLALNNLSCALSLTPPAHCWFPFLRFVTLTHHLAFYLSMR